MEDKGRSAERPARFPAVFPGSLVFAGGSLFALLKAGVNGLTSAEYGPSSSLYITFNLFLVCSVLGGCLLAAALENRLYSRFGRLACCVLLPLPFLLCLLPAPAGTWGAGPLTDCFLKCLLFYGPYLAVLAAVPVLVSILEAGPAVKAPGPSQVFAADVSLGSIGIFCLGAGLTGQFLALSDISGAEFFQPAYALFAGLSMLYLFRTRPRPGPAPAKPSDRSAALAGAGIGAWCIVTPYLMLLASGSVSDDLSHRALCFAFAVCFIPALRSYLTRLAIIAATLGALACLVLARDPLPALLFLLLLQLGRKVYWLRSEGSGLAGFCSRLTAGAAGGVLLGGAGILWLDERLSPGVSSAVYSLALPLMWVWIIITKKGKVVYKAVSEHGAYEVVDKHMGYRALLNRKIDHGTQFFEGTLAPAPGSYYSPDSPPAQVLKKNVFERVALVGLGSGALCSYAAPASRWTLYELDPEIVNIAKTYFTFLGQCKAGLDIVLGDAGKTLLSAPAGEFDLIILDAYTGGKIPEHLASPEAFRACFGKLKKGGALLLHATGHKKGLLKSIGYPAAEAGAELSVKASPVWNVMRSDWILAGGAALSDKMRGLGWKPVADRPK